jgi:hypothetical protein
MEGDWFYFFDKMGGIIYDVGWLRVSGGMENQLAVVS